MCLIIKFQKIVSHLARQKSTVSACSLNTLLKSRLISDQANRENSNVLWKGPNGSELSWLQLALFLA